MAYLGRRGALAPVNSADIPDNSITAAKIVDGAIDFQDEIGFLENKATTQNLSGTYSTERMYLNDSYTLTGDVTVTGHLALGSIADADVVITQDSTERTITGSGTLESGGLLQSKQTDLTGMTGELGSTVTFPAGTAIQAKEGLLQSQVTTSSNAFTGTGLSVSITPSSSSSKFLVIATTTADNEADGRLIELTLYRNSVNLGGSNGMVQIYGSGARVGSPVTLTKLDTPNTTSEITYEVYWNSNNSNAVYLGSSSQINSIVALEIAG